MAPAPRRGGLLLALGAAQLCGGEGSFVAAPSEAPPSEFALDYVALYEAGAARLGLNATDPMILAALWSRTGKTEYAAAASANLAAVATGDAAWLAADRAWTSPTAGRQSWIDFDHSTTTFGSNTPGFLGCTQYGLLASWCVMPAPPLCPRRSCFVASV